MALDTQDFNPAFQARLTPFMKALADAGIKASINSGYRTPEYQNQMYQNHLAVQAKRPLPYPNVEAPSVVAPAWGSFHNFGLAADFTLDNPADYARMAAIAPKFGLTGIGASDPGHIQMGGGGLSQVLAANKIDQGWRPTSQPAPAQGAVVGGGGSSGGGGASGSWGGGANQSQLDQHIQFIRDYATKIGVNPDLALGIASKEGMNAIGFRTPNQASTVDVTNGQPFSFGDFQLNTKGGLGVDALKAGIDPRDPTQWQAADRFALDQMKRSVAPWKGDPVASQYLATGKVAPFTAGTTINTAGGPAAGSQTGDASGGAGAGAGGVASTPGTSSTGQPSGALAGFQAGSPAEKMMQTAAKSLGADGSGASQPPSMPPPPPVPPAQAAGGPMMMGPGGQNTFGQRAAEQNLAQQGFMVQPSLAALTPGVRSPPMTPPGSATGMPGLPGTTLNSPSQLQMALMTGAMSPADFYANSAAYGLGN